MTRTVFRFATLAAAVAVAASAAGCGVIANVGNAVNNLTEVADLSNKLTASSKLTFTAEYKLADGSGTATVVQQPPQAAFLGKDGRFILTTDSLLICSGSGSKTTCQRTPNTSGSMPSADQAAYMTAVAGAGFISTPMAIALMGAASVVPSVNITKTKKDVAGLASTCLRATGISSVRQAGPNNVDMKELTVCVADNGVLTGFVGVGTDGSNVGVELTKYSTTVDPKAFTPPKGAKITDLAKPSA
jgi:hypothetical protein